MTNIEIRVNGASAVKVKQEGLLTAGMVGATATFAFDSAWAGLTKTAVFRCGGLVRDVIGVEDSARIPTEVLCADTELYVGVEGRSGDGAVVIPTVWVRAAYVYPGANASGDPSADPTLPVWAQIQAMIGDLAKLGTVDKSSLVAAVNEALRSGGGTVSQETIARLVEEYLEAHPPVVTETDPTVPDWAKQTKKPTYTPEEIGAQPAGDYALRDEIPVVPEMPEIPSALPNPHKLTFTGAVNAEYDGSEAVEVEIPAGGGVTRIETADSVKTIEPNKFYVFPEMASLEIILGGVADPSIVQEYKFRFASGATATTLILPQSVKGSIAVSANTVNEISIVDGYALCQSWAVEQ